MKALSFLAVILALGFTFGANDAEAKRMGSGKSVGMQRQSAVPARQPAASPQQTQNSSATAARQTTSPAATPQPARPSWMGPIAGLAAGLGLAALASHLGFGEGLANILMIGLLILSVMAVIGFFLRRRTPSQAPAFAGAGHNARRGDGMTHYDSFVDKRSAPFQAGPVAGESAQNVRNIPADFDIDAFVRTAKVNFIRLQAANDSGNTDDIREFTTPEMFAEIMLTLSERAGMNQVTDVLSIDADVIDVVEEDSRYIVSIRFTGQIREDNGPTENIDEVWHLVKQREGRGGWLLAGIQQLD